MAASYSPAFYLCSISRIRISQYFGGGTFPFFKSFFSIRVKWVDLLSLCDRPHHFSKGSFDCHGNGISLSWLPPVVHVIFGVWGALIMHNQQLGDGGIIDSLGASGSSTASAFLRGPWLDSYRKRLSHECNSTLLTIPIGDPFFSFPQRKKTQGQDEWWHKYELLIENEMSFL